MTAPKARIKILCVDDEPQVLEGLALHLRRNYEMFTAVSGPLALATLESEPSIAVIVSDMRMPGMDGAAFLARSRQVAPDAVRILLTGEADINSAIHAVNEGQIFRFLTKPCPPATLLAAIEAAVHQHRLVTAERVLLEQTLHGAVKALTDVLALASPASFGRATRIKRVVADLAEALALPERWPVEVAAMLSQLGAVALPAETADKLHHGRPLTPDEQRMVARAPAVAEQLLGNIPRLEDVREILATYARPFHRSDPPGHDAGKHRMERWRQILHVAIDFDVLEAQGVLSGVAIDTLRGRFGRYDPQVIEALVAVRGRTTLRHEVRELTMRALAPGMVFTQDLRLANGTLLVGRGGEVTAGLLARIRNFKPGSVKEPVRMRVRISG